MTAAELAAWMERGPRRPTAAETEAAYRRDLEGPHAFATLPRLTKPAGPMSEPAAPYGQLPDRHQGVPDAYRDGPDGWASAYGIRAVADNTEAFALRAAQRRLEDDLTAAFQRFEETTGASLRGVDYDVIRDEADRTAAVRVTATESGR